MNMDDKARERAEKIIRMLRDHDPELKHPGQLTDEIMGSLDDIGQVEVKTQVARKKMIMLNINFRRLVAAAAIVLLGTLGYEQYIVLDRINRLEIQQEEAAVKRGPAAAAPYIHTWEASVMMLFREMKNNNRSLADKVRDVREMMKTIDRNYSAEAGNYRTRAWNKYNSMIIR